MADGIHRFKVGQTVTLSADGGDLPKMLDIERQLTDSDAQFSKSKPDF